MEQSPRLSLSYLAPSQAQKHVTVNETFRRLDQLVQLTVRSRNTSAEPASPADGDAYILPASPTGTSWASYSENNIAVFQDGAWGEFAAVEGWRAYVADEAALTTFNGNAWAAISSGGGSETATKFGVNTTADTANRLAVKSDAILFNYDDVTPGNDDCQVKINKKAEGDTASLLFQSGASGRAEFGLTGDDDFHVKVSANGSTWNDALTIDKSSAEITTSTHFNVGGDLAVRDGSPAIVFQDTNGTGNAHTGLFGFNDSADTQKAWFGFGSTGNSDFTFYNSYAGDTVFYTSGSKRGYIGSSGGWVMGTPTGGDKGAGTINASAVYDDNVLLTCYVFDQAIDRAIDPAKWDAKVPDRVIKGAEDGPDRIEKRRHEPMRKFQARIGSTEDPLTLDGYAKHWREKRHLSSMPNETTFDPEQGMAAGEWIQRLIETVEIQAILIEELNTRVKAIAANARRPER